MAVLTESKIRKLMKTADFKENKRLVLEPGTIITPSAKSYLTNVKIEYQKVGVAPETDSVEDVTVKVVQPVKSNRATLQWQLALDQLSSKLLFDQQYFESINKKELIIQVDLWIQTLQDFKYMNVTVKNQEAQDDSKDNFVPHYTEEETVLRLYARYLDVKELELEKIACLNDYLLMDEYHALISNCRMIANDIWLTMIHQIEGKSKERRS